MYQNITHYWLANSEKVFPTFIHTFLGKSLTKIKGKDHIYLDKSVMGSIYVITYKISVEIPKVKNKIQPNYNYPRFYLHHGRFAEDLRRKYNASSAMRTQLMEWEIFHPACTVEGPRKTS